MYCNNQKKSIWGICSNQETEKGEIINCITKVLCNKQYLPKFENGFVDLKTLFSEINPEKNPYSYGTLSGSPIEFGVPILPSKLQESRFLYFTEFEVKEATRILNKQIKRSDRYKEFHITKEITVNNIKTIVKKIYDLSSPKIEVGWKICDENKNEVPAEKLVSFFSENKSERYSVLIKGDRGTGKSTMARYLSSCLTNCKNFDFVFLFSIKDKNFSNFEEFVEFYFEEILSNYQFYKEDKPKIVEIIKEKEKTGRIIWIFDLNVINKELSKFLEGINNLIVVSASNLTLEFQREFFLYGFSETIKSTLRKNSPELSFFLNQKKFSQILQIPSFLKILKNNSDRSHMKLVEMIHEEVLSRFGEENYLVESVLGKLSFFLLKEKTICFSEPELIEQLSDFENLSNIEKESLIQRLVLNSVIRRTSKNFFEFSFSLFQDFFAASFIATVLNQTETNNEKVQVVYSNLGEYCGKHSLVPAFLSSKINEMQKKFEILEKFEKKNAYIPLANCFHFASSTLIEKSLKQDKKKEIFLGRLFDTCCLLGVNNSAIKMFLDAELDGTGALLSSVQQENEITTELLLSKVEITEEIIIELLSVNFELIRLVPKEKIELSVPFFRCLCKSGTLEDLKKYFVLKSCHFYLEKVFIEATNYGRLEMMEFLFNQGAVNLNDALICAARSNHHSKIEVFEFLINFGANNLGESFVDLFQREHFEAKLAKFFFSKGIDVSYRNCFGRCALDHACRGISGENTIEAIEFLIKSGAKDLQTSYNYAFESFQIDKKVKSLLELNGCTEEKFLSSQKSLNKRYKKENEEQKNESDVLEEILLEASSETPSKEKIKELAEVISLEKIVEILFILCKKKEIDPSVLDLFKEFVNKRDNFGNGVLYYTCLGGNLKILKYFLQKEIVDVEDILNGINQCLDLREVEKMVHYVETKNFDLDVESKYSHSVLLNPNYCRHICLKKYLIGRLGKKINFIFKTIDLRENEEQAFNYFFNHFQFDEMDQNGITALFYYCQNKRISFPVLKMIVERTKKHDVFDRDNRSSLHMLCINKKSNLEMLNLIYKQVASTIDKLGYFPSYYSLRYLNEDFYKFFKSQEESKLEESLRKCFSDVTTKLCWSCINNDVSFIKENLEKVRNSKKATYFCFKNCSNEVLIHLLNEKLLFKNQALLGALIGGRSDEVLRELVKNGANYEGNNFEHKTKFSIAKNIVERNTISNLENFLCNRKFFLGSISKNHFPILLEFVGKTPISNAIKNIFQKAVEQKNLTKKNFKEISKNVREDISKKSKSPSFESKVSFVVLNCRMKFETDDLFVFYKERWLPLFDVYQYFRKIGVASVMLNIFHVLGAQHFKESLIKNLQINTIVNIVETEEDCFYSLPLFSNILNNYLFENLSFKASYEKSSFIYSNSRFVKYEDESIETMGNQREYNKSSFVLANFSNEYLKEDEIEKLANLHKIKEIKSHEEFKSLNSKPMSPLVLILFFSVGKEATVEISKQQKKNKRVDRSREGVVVTGAPIGTDLTFEDILKEIEKFHPSALFVFALDKYGFHTETDSFYNWDFSKCSDVFFRNTVFRSQEKHWQFLNKIIEGVIDNELSFESSFMDYVIKNEGVKKGSVLKYSFSQIAIEHLSNSIHHLSLISYKQSNRLFESNPYVNAVIEGNEKRVKFLLQNQCHGINGTDSSGRTPLIISVLKDSFEITLMLLNSKDIDINAIDPLSGNTALHICCAKYQDTIVNVFIDKKANLNVLNYNFSSPLHFAFKYGTITNDVQEKIRAQQICTNLIQKGANPNNDVYGEVSLTVYGSIWKKKEPLFIDWYEKVTKQHFNFNSNFNLNDNFNWKEFTYPKKFLEDPSGDFKLKSKKILIIDCNPKKNFEKYEKIQLCEKLVNGLKNLFESLKFSENVEYCSTLEELKSFKETKFRLIYFSGYFSSGLHFLNPNGEAIEIVSPEMLSSLFPATKTILFNLENSSLTNNQVISFHENQFEAKYLISNLRPLTDSEKFYFTLHYFRGSLKFGDSPPEAFDRAFKNLSQQSISTDAKQSFLFTDLNN